MNKYYLVSGSRSDRVYLPSSASFVPSASVGKTYNCSITGSSTAPSTAACSVSTAGSDPGSGSGGGTGGGTGPAAGGGSATTTEPKDDKPLTAIIPKINASLAGLTATKECPASGYYASGILKGVVCKGATKGQQGLLTVLQVIRNVIYLFLLPIAGTIFILMFIIGGILYMTSAGNDKRAETAKKTLTYAIFGLVILILSYTIVSLFARVIGGGVTTT
jgi:hypothetical protein